jgi:prepilin-type processing-associated H-X9-DG protein
MVLGLVSWTAIITLIVLAVFRLIDGHNHIYGLSNFCFVDGHHLWSQVFLPWTAIITFMVVVYRLMYNHNRIHGLSHLHLIDGHNYIYGLRPSSHGRP